MYLKRYFGYSWGSPIVDPGPVSAREQLVVVVDLQGDFVLLGLKLLLLLLFLLALVILLEKKGISISSQMAIEYNIIILFYNFLSNAHFIKPCRRPVTHKPDFGKVL